MKRLSFFELVWAVAGSVSVRGKILGIIVGLVLLLGVGITLQVRLIVSQAFTAQLQEQGMSVTSDLAARSTDLVLLNDLFALHQLLLETQRNNANVRYAIVLNEQGHVVAHTFGDQFPVGLLELNVVDLSEHHQTVLLETDEGRVWDTAVPMLDGRAGSVRVGLSDAALRQTAGAVTGQLILTTLLVSVVGITAAVGLTWVITRPIISLVEATHRVAKGDFSPHVRRWANDEIGALADAFNQMTAELARTDELRRERESLRRQLLERVITTQEEERKRIARELHDSASQTLTSLLVGLRVLESSGSDCQIQEQVRDLRAIAAETLDEVHSLAVELRPRLLDDVGLSAALQRLVEDWQARHKTPVDLLIHSGSARLPGTVETALYRIVQEALTNVARHAQAQSVSVLVERRGAQVVVVVEDDGIGFNSQESQDGAHLGLLGVKERTELLNGKLTIESEPGHGTSVFVEIPLAEEGERERLLEAQP